MKREGKIKVIVVKESVGYSAASSIGNDFIATEANTYDDIKIRILEAINFAFEDGDIEYTIDDLRFEFDLESFFDFYKVINAKAPTEEERSDDELTNS